MRMPASPKITNTTMMNNDMVHSVGACPGKARSG
jgi:hypothetical protein